MAAASRALGAAVDALVATLKAASAVLLVAILAINTLEIVARSFFSVSYSWIFETNLLLASWLYFLGIVPVYRRGGDINLLGYERFLAGRGLTAYRVFLELATAGTFAVLAWFSWILIELQLPFRTPGMRLPNAAFTAPLLIGLLGLVAVALDRALTRPRRDRPSIEAGL